MIDHWKFTFFPLLAIFIEGFLWISHVHRCSGFSWSSSSISHLWSYEGFLEEWQLQFPDPKSRWLTHPEIATAATAAGCACGGGGYYWPTCHLLWKKHSHLGSSAGPLMSEGSGDQAQMDEIALQFSNLIVRLGRALWLFFVILSYFGVTRLTALCKPPGSLHSGEAACLLDGCAQGAGLCDLSGHWVQLWWIRRTRSMPCIFTRRRGSSSAPVRTELRWWHPEQKGSVDVSDEFKFCVCPHN